MDSCPYCDTKNEVVTFKSRLHPFDKSHGPFDLYVCRECQSLITSPMPEAQDLANFYLRSSNGMPEVLREARERYPQDYIYKKYVSIVSKEIQALPDDFSWLDVGAGGGEFAFFFKEAFPKSKGNCVDFHLAPKILDGIDLNWHQRDLNQDINIDQKFDLIISFAVFEHVLDPKQFFRNLSAISRPGTKIVLVFPKYDSFLSKLMKTKWPYFIPGEHLTVPSTKGLNALIPRYFKNYRVESMNMPYSAKYYLSYMGLDKLNSIIPFDLNLPSPSGLFKIVITA